MTHATVVFERPESPFKPKVRVELTVKATSSEQAAAAAVLHLVHLVGGPGVAETFELVMPILEYPAVRPSPNQ